MKYNLVFLICTLMAIPLPLLSQNRIQIHIPSAQEEAQYVWRNIQDIGFFDANNYQVSFPKGALVDTLLSKARMNRLQSNDYQTLEDFMASKVYNEADYQAGFQKIEEQRDLINNMINQVTTDKRKWAFKSFPTYTINLTLYGPGGSYDPENGSILIYTTTKGQFKQYDNPANTLIHEVVHIGIQASIINALNVPHPLKERIVDTFVMLNFEKDLPEYRIQNMGDPRIDDHLKKKKHLKDLKEIVQTFMQYSQP